MSLSHHPPFPSATPTVSMTVGCRRYEVVGLLGQFGADVNVRDNIGSTAYDIANMISELIVTERLHKSLSCLSR